MDKVELIEFLKENLRVKITTDMDGDVNVALILCDDEISKDWTVISK